MSINFTLVRDADPAKSAVTAYLPGSSKPLIASGTHPFWDKIVAGLLVDDVSVKDLFNIAETAARQILSDRVSYAYGTLYVDGDKLDDSLANHIVRLIEQGDNNFPAFIYFLENLLANPNEDSRKQLYRWLDKHNFTITYNGLIVGYKAVEGSDAAGWTSTREGPAIVNGVPHTEGKVPQPFGGVVTMPRSNVTHDPHTACDSGLHVGSWEYFQSFFSNNTKLQVHVNPRDVVSVPHDAGDSKLRCCRYEIIGKVTQPYTDAVIGKPAPVKTRFDELKARVKDKEPTVKHPTDSQFWAMHDVAKSKKKGFVTYASTVGKWTLLPNCDGSQRTHWSV